MNVADVFNAANGAIHSALKNPAQSEPQLVANLVWQIPAHFNSIPAIRATGVFVHGRPLVTCSNFPKAKPPSVEIGDLLFLRSKKARSGKITARQALLLQAKKANVFPTHPDNLNQLHIYANWPTLTYKSGMGSKNGASCTLRGSDLSDAAQYLIFPDSCCRVSQSCRPWPFRYYGVTNDALTAHATWARLTHYRGFLETLIEFVFGNAGKRYRTLSKPDLSGWTTLIHDLVTATKDATSVYISRASSGTTDQRLRFMCGALDLSSALSVGDDATPLRGFAQADGSDGSPEIPSEPMFEEPAGGLPIVEFVIAEDEDA